MPRTARASVGGYCYHVLNRGNARAEVFHRPGDYEAFLDTLAEASIRIPMRTLAYCLMPNHFHLVLRPHGDGDLSRWMHWLLTAHVRRYFRCHGSSGHIWQGRFKAFPVQDDAHLRTLLRYVERNPLRAGLVARAEHWPWSSLGRPVGPPTLHPDPIPRDAAWVDFVNAAMTDPECDAIRLCLRRSAPYGSDAWTRRTAERLGLQSSLRPPAALATTREPETIPPPGAIPRRFPDRRRGRNSTVPLASRPSPSRRESGLGPLESNTHSRGWSFSPEGPKCIMPFGFA